MKPKTDRQKLFKRLDDLTSDICRDRAEGFCHRCGGIGIEPHHLFGRHGSVRWDLDNLYWVCRECHDWIHAHREEYNAYMWLEMGFIYDGLHQKAQVVVHYKNADLLEILEGLKRK